MTLAVGLLLAGTIVLVAVWMGVLFRRDGVGSRLTTVSSEHGDSAEWVAATRATDRSGIRPWG